MKKYIVNFTLLFLDFAFVISFYFFVATIRESLGETVLASLNRVIFSNFLVFSSIVMATLYYEKIYTLRYDFWEETKLTIKALFLSFIIILAIIMLGKASHEYSRLFFITYFLGLMIFLPIYRRVIKKALFKLSFFKKRIKIVGNEEQGDRLTEEFHKNWYLGYALVETNPDAIFIASKNSKIEVINRFLKKYSLSVKDIYLIPYMSSINFSQSEIIELFNIKTSVIKIENNLLKKENLFLKELFEKIVVVLALPLFLLLHAIISYAIKRDSSGEIIFKQKRLGKNGIIFKCYKYRTMIVNSDNILIKYLKENPDEIEYYSKYHKYKKDPRITKVGNFLRKTSLDELPQLINILKGEMGLIGPRPYMPKESSKISDSIDMILRVKPGISGLWQVSGRSNLSFESRKNLDVWYIQNWSLWMDVVILLKTLKVVFIKTGAK